MWTYLLFSQSHGVSHLSWFYFFLRNIGQLHIIDIPLHTIIYFSKEKKILQVQCSAERQVRL